MRTVLFLSLLTIAVPASTAHASSSADPMRCEADRLHLTGSDGPAKLRRLDQLPPAAETLTVLRKVGGCEKPVVVRYGIGGNPSLGGQHPTDVPPGDR